MYKRILLAYDGSDAGQKALLDCLDLAQWSQSEVVLIAVMLAGCATVTHPNSPGVPLGGSG